MSSSKLEEYRNKIADMQVSITNSQKLVKNANNQINCLNDQLAVAGNELASANSRVIFFGEKYNEVKVQLLSLNECQSENGRLKSSLEAAEKLVNNVF